MKITLFPLLLCAVCSLGVQAKDDVTNRYLSNADFADGPAVISNICSYGKDMTGDDLYGFQYVNGWEIHILQGDESIADYPNSGMGGAVMTYGSANELRGNRISAPAAGPDGAQGNCLGLFAVWGCGGYYFQDVTLPAGKYTISVLVYNGSGTQPYTSYIGFLSEGDQSHVAQELPVVGKWTTLTTTFTLQEETSGRIALGYQSTGLGSGAAPHLFFDCIRIERENAEIPEETPENWVNCTDYISNPGFDEDLSFNWDGSAAKLIEFTGVTSERSAFYEAGDGSIYTKCNDGRGYNAAGEPSWYGFIARIKGWNVTNQTQTPEWIYYGCIPYGIDPSMMALGEDSGLSEVIPEKPTAIANEENTGVLFLKAGWENACTYKQTVTLPRAKYRLSYYICNTNVSKSRLYQEATNLCNVTCNGVTFVDDEGFNSEGWVKHTIDFIPVDSFSIEFGCRASANYSYNNPILWVDGIELYQMDEATNEEVDEAYKELLDRANSLYEVMHFAADRSALQAAISQFTVDKDYVALYQAILMGEESEGKYLSVTSEGGAYQTVAARLVTQPDDDASAIVRFAYEKMTAWMTSSTATYVDADSYVERLDAYANLYVPAYKDAADFAISVGQEKAVGLLGLMETQKQSLMQDELLSVGVVEEYVKALIAAMEEIDIVVEQCAPPTIYYENGVLTFKSETEGARCVATITDDDVKTHYGNTVALGVLYEIQVYATKDGWQDSEVTTATLCWIEATPYAEGEHITIDVKEVKARPVLIQQKDNTLLINGIESGTSVNVYDLAGRRIADTLATEGTTRVALGQANHSNQTIIVRMGERSVKVRLR